MKLVLFEDEQWKACACVAHARPVYTLRCGAFTLQERVHAWLQYTRSATYTSSSTLCQLPPQRFPHMLGISRPHLMRYYGADGGIAAMLRDSKPLVLVNGRALDIAWLPRLLEAPLDTVYVTNGMLLGARLSPSLASAVLYYLRDQHATAALDELYRFARIEEQDARLITYPWDLVALTGEQLVQDTPLLAYRLPRYAATNYDNTITVHNAEHIYVAPSAILDGQSVLDARDGPIIIDEHAHIEPFSFIQGPTYIGAKTLVSSALVRGETSIGPVCRIGGEVEASIIQGYSNKHHDGFLGHSWLGEWVNIGAMTTTSDLKNTYGSVRVLIEGEGNLDSGILKLGAFFADHVKLGIGLHLTGGAVVGVGSNIYGMHMVPKNVPPFTWGGDVFREYRIDSMINVTRKVMSRRNITMSAAYEAMLRDVFAATRSNRAILHDTSPPSPPSPSSNGKPTTIPTTQLRL